MKGEFIQECVKVVQDVGFSGRYGDLPLRNPVETIFCGRPYLLDKGVRTSEIPKGLKLDDEDRASEEAGCVPTGPPPTPVYVLTHTAGFSACFLR